MSKIPNLSKKEKQALEEFKKEITRELKGEILELKLFGSKARGDSRKDSDIDVLLVLKNPTEKDKDIVYNIVGDILLKYEIYLSVKIFPQKEYNHLNSIPSVFMQIVRKEAILL